MTTRFHLPAALMAILLAAVPAPAQSASELLQKGIYSQETLGDVDGAIQLYRQLTSSAGVPKQLAAQAQYQLVLSMLQKGDPAAAAHELDILTRDFSAQQELIDKARKLIPGAATLLAPPWGDGEALQLNIKRNGEFTGEYLYYSATPFPKTTNAINLEQEQRNAIYLEWKLVTKGSTRGIRSPVERETLRPMGTNYKKIVFDNDVLGDASAAPFAGPAIDAEPLVFRMRMLPLAVGYKTTLTTLPFLLGQGVPRSVELAVTAVEPVQTVAGKFSCYKVTFASLGQTFWIGVDGARPLVKFQSGNTEAELVYRWGPTALEDALDFLAKASWSGNFTYGLQEGEGRFGSPKGPFRTLEFSVHLWRLYTSPAEIEQDLRNSCADVAKGDLTLRADSVQMRSVGGNPAISCIIDAKASSPFFLTFVRTAGLILKFQYDGGEIGIFRWMFEPVINTIKLPKD